MAAMLREARAVPRAHDPQATPAFLRRWVLMVTLGEGLGFLAPTLVGGLAFAAGVSGWSFYVLMVVAGAVEGCALGLAQSTALRRSGAPVDRGRWTGLTSAAAAFAWALGMLPSTLTGVDWTTPAVVAVVMVGAAALLCSIPAAQWLELRHVTRRAALWLPVNIAAWGVGLLWAFAPSPMVDTGTHPVVVVGLFVAAGCLMAVTVAVVTGLGLQRYVLAPGEAVRATT